MNNQEAFDLMVRHMEKQGRRSVCADNHCVMRSPNGDRCVIGALVGDSFDPGMEELTVLEIQKRVPSLGHLETSLLVAVQRAHDNGDAWPYPDKGNDPASQLRLRLRDTAARYGLDAMAVDAITEWDQFPNGNNTSSAEPINPTGNI